MIFLLILWAIIIIFAGGWIFLHYFAEKENEIEMMWGYVYLLTIWLIPFFILTLLGAALITGVYKLFLVCEPWLTKTFAPSKEKIKEWLNTLRNRI